jgi:hypothetical protein
MSGHTVESLVPKRTPKELTELCALWGARNGEAGGDAAAVLGTLFADEEVVRQRLAELPEKLHAVLREFRKAPAAMQTHGELRHPGAGAETACDKAAAATKATFASRFEARAALAALVREGFLWPARSRAWEDLGSDGLAVPQELAECMARLERHDQGKLESLLSLQGQLGTCRFTASEHARKIYKLYLLPEAIDARITALDPATHAVFERALVDFGGIMPLAEIGDVAAARDQGALAKRLEQAQLGSVRSLPLERVGLQPVEAVVLFREIAAHALVAHAECHPPRIEQTLSCGIDLVTNVTRFLRELGTGDVQFTAEGKIYKASEKRIGKALIPLPGGYLDGEAMTAWIYKVCLQRRLIDRKGARSLGLTQLGCEFDGLALHEKLRQLLAAAIEDRDLPGEPFHQVRLRRVLLRHVLPRVLGKERAEAWQGAMLLPYLARCSYLTMLDAENVRAHFAARASYAGYVPTESLAQLCWNLLAFMKRRLFPLGIVELGLCDKRPVAVRLSRLGREMLEEGGDGKGKPSTGERATWIVNPDFEVLVFPGDDLHDALHVLDRFARRTKSDHVHHYVLSRETMCAGRALGISFEQIMNDLTDRARVPVPQNVLWTLADWAGAGRA